MTSNGRRSSGGASWTRRARARIPTTTNTSPTNTQRHEKYVVAMPPISGPTATATAPAPITRPYARGLPSGGKFPATSATIAGRIRAAPIPSSTDHPSTSMARLGASAVVSEPMP